MSITKEELYSQPVKLPSLGLLYPEGHPLHKVESIDITPMTTLSEDILTSKSLNKKGKTLDVLINSCIVNKSYSCEQMLTFDRNTLLIAIRAMSYGPKYKVKIQCPNDSCESKFDNEFDLSQCLVTYFDEIEEKYKLTPDEKFQFSFVLPNTRKNVKFRFLTGQDNLELNQLEENIKKRNLSQNDITNIVSNQWIQQIMEIDGDTSKMNIGSFVRKMIISDSVALRNYITDITPGISLDFEVKCKNCDEEFTLTMPIETDFFWPKRR